MTNRPQMIRLSVVFPQYTEIMAASRPFSGVDLAPEAVAQILKPLGLVLLSGPDQVCQANAPETRKEYRTAATTDEVLSYIQAAVQIARDQASDLHLPDVIPLPADEKEFWELVQMGTTIRDH